MGPQGEEHVADFAVSLDLRETNRARCVAKWHEKPIGKLSRVFVTKGICRRCGVSDLDSRMPGGSFWVSPYLFSDCAPPARIAEVRAIIQRNLPYCIGEALKTGDPMPPNLSASCEWGLHAICDNTGRLAAPIVAGDRGRVHRPSRRASAAGPMRMRMPRLSARP